jgi:hypothetical protein
MNIFVNMKVYLENGAEGSVLIVFEHQLIQNRKDFRRFWQIREIQSRIS